MNYAGCSKMRGTTILNMIQTALIAEMTLFGHASKEDKMHKLLSVFFCFCLLPIFIGCSNTNLKAGENNLGKEQSQRVTEYSDDGVKIVFSGDIEPLKIEPNERTNDVTKTIIKPYNFIDGRCVLEIGNAILKASDPEEFSLEKYCYVELDGIWGRVLRNRGWLGNSRMVVIDRTTGAIVKIEVGGE
jgi:hypothetical protein